MFKELSIGKSGEKYVQDLMINAGFKCDFNEDYDKRYDYDLIVDMNNNIFTIECKYDLYSAKSGNIAIEVHNSKKNEKSGIYRTIADVWVHLIPNKNRDRILAYAIQTPKLKYFIETTTPHKIITSGGDKNSDMMLYRADIILEQFSRFDDVTEREKLIAIFGELLVDKQ